MSFLQSRDGAGRDWAGWTVQSQGYLLTFSGPFVRPLWHGRAWQLRCWRLSLFFWLGGSRVGWRRRAHAPMMILYYDRSTCRWHGLDEACGAALTAAKRDQNSSRQPSHRATSHHTRKSKHTSNHVRSRSISGPVNVVDQHVQSQAFVFSILLYY